MVKQMWEGRALYQLVACGPQVASARSWESWVPVGGAPGSRSAALSVVQINHWDEFYKLKVKWGFGQHAVVKGAVTSDNRIKYLTKANL